MFQVVGSHKLYEKVVEQIRTMIVQGVYKKGDMLPSEKELINMMGVSRITIREALRLLSEAGVIQTQKGKGSFVIVEGKELICQEDGQECYRDRFLNSTRARLLLEPAVAREVALIATEQELEKIGQCMTKKNFEDGEFHLEILRAAHNPVILQWFDQLSYMETAPSIQSLVPPAGQKSVSAQIAQQHQHIYDALKARNSEFAYFYMKAHLSYIWDIYEEYFSVFY